MSTEIPPKPQTKPGEADVVLVTCEGKPALWVKLMHIPAGYTVADPQPATAAQPVVSSSSRRK